MDGLEDWHRERREDKSLPDERYGKGILATSLGALQQGTASKYFQYHDKTKNHGYTDLYFLACSSVDRFMSSKERLILTPNKFLKVVSMSFLLRGQNFSGSLDSFINKLSSTLIYNRYYLSPDGSKRNGPSILVLPLLERVFEMTDAMGMGVQTTVLYNDQLTKGTIQLGEMLARELSNLPVSQPASVPVQTQAQQPRTVVQQSVKSVASPVAVTKKLESRTNPAPVTQTSAVQASAQTDQPQVSAVPHSQTKVVTEQPTSHPAASDPLGATAVNANISEGSSAAKKTGSHPEIIAGLDNEQLLLIGIGAIILLALFCK